MDLQESPPVTVIIVCWNSSKFLKECLDSVLHQSYHNYHIVVVDNNSSDDSVTLIEREYPMVTVIKNSDNYGYAKGNNIGIRHATGKYIVILNPDTVVEKKWLQELVKTAERDTRIGICASKVLLYHHRSILNSVGLYKGRDGKTRHLGDGEIDNGQYDMLMEIFAAPGVSMLLRKEMLEEVGLFDEAYFMYDEDLDLSWRAKLAGWKCVYVPHSRVYHIRNATVKMKPEIYLFLRYCEQRNRIWTLLKNFSLASLFIFGPHLLKYDISRVVKSISGFFKTNRPPVEIKADVDALRFFPINKREKIQSIRVVPEQTIRQWFTSPMRSYQ